ncbi:MAG: 30S ribosomal protein S19e [Candidatus Thermoplasmatota archaeon]|nr:30S ribosomal protein S19e [Candidatus Thermoplasmatota archaeon]
MTTVYDVPTDALIAKVAQKLKENEKVKPTEWAPFVKLGLHTEKAPVQHDWWYTRAASMMRKIYIEGPLGTERLRQMYGGPKDRGTKPDRVTSGSGAVVRNILKQLDDAKLVEAIKGKGRLITPAGRKFMDGAAYEVKKSLEATIPALKKY